MTQTIEQLVMGAVTNDCRYIAVHLTPDGWRVYAALRTSQIARGWCYRQAGQARVYYVSQSGLIYLHHANY